jgi:protease II
VLNYLNKKENQKLSYITEETKMVEDHKKLLEETVLPLLRAKTGSSMKTGFILREELKLQEMMTNKNLNGLSSQRQKCLFPNSESVINYKKVFEVWLFDFFRTYLMSREVKDKSDPRYMVQTIQSKCFVLDFHENQNSDRNKLAPDLEGSIMSHINSASKLLDYKVDTSERSTIPFEKQKFEELAGLNLKP